MTSVPHAAHGADDHAHHGSYLESRGSFLADLKNWALTIDHKKLGVMYLTAVMTMFLLGGLAALYVRLELASPIQGTAFAEATGSVGKTLFRAESSAEAGNIYNRFMTMHGAIMVFMFIVPGIPASLGNFLLPLMLGAKDVAFPRLNLLSWYIFVLGSIFGVFGIILGGVETGWTFYTPYSTTTAQGSHEVLIMVTAAFILGFSSILTGLNFVVTVHKLRAPGMGWFDMPLFVWAIYSTALIQVLATPVIGITLLLLIFERLFHVGIFDPSIGGDPVLFQHFFWFYSHPVVYVMILPGMGIISDALAVFSRKKIFGYRAIAFSSLSIAGISFLVWGHHLFTSEGELIATIFSALTFLVAIPTAVKVFNWIATLYKSSIDLKTPMLYALSFLFLFSIGGLTGLPLGALSTDLHLHDSYFVVAHFHYVMMGGTVMAFLAGIHMWWPKMTGKMYNEFWGRVGAVTVFIGFNTTFFIQFFMGVRGMPRRYADYQKVLEHDPQLSMMHMISTVGSWILLLGFLVHLFTFLHSIFLGPKAPANPWGGLTLEWEADSPPTEHNFHHEPIVKHGPYDFDDVVPPHCAEDQFPRPAKVPGAAAH